MDWTPSNPGHGQRKESDDCLPDGRPRSIDGDHTLAHHQAAQRAPRDAPARYVVSLRDSQQDLRAGPAAEQARQRDTERNVYRGCPPAVANRRWDAWNRFAPADAQQEQAHQNVMDGQLGDRIERQWEEWTVALHRRDEAALRRLDAEVAAR